MILFLRIILIGLISYLIFSSFLQNARKGHKTAGSPGQAEKSKHISKKTGEYIDYEETDK
jgi:hypothetical protein